MKPHEYDLLPPSKRENAVINMSDEERARYLEYASIMYVCTKSPIEKEIIKYQNSSTTS